jgi:outer membrane lipoprotein-sorting protein
MKFMRQPKTFIGTVILLIAVDCSVMAPAPLHAQTPAPSLQSVLSQMDASAPKFQDTEADITVDQYTAVVQDHQTQTGSTAYRRVTGSMEMVIHLQAGNGAAATEVLYKNGELDVYQPAASSETIISAGNNRGEYDSMLATGFGATGKELSAAWTITAQGMESIDGVPTAKLDLVPKDPNIRNNFSHFTIWVDLTRDISLKQIEFQPDGDSRTVTYSNIRYNKRPAPSLFTLHVAPGTQVTHK